jgi:antitoxin VapB
MSLNIKNAETHALAAELARRLGISMTDAVTVALKEKLAATESEAVVKARKDRMLKMAHAIAERLTPEQLTTSVDDELYDEQGIRGSSTQ